MHSNHHTTLNELIPFKKVSDQYPNLFTHESWAWAVRRRKKNGLDPAFRKVGKQLFVNLRILAECIDGKNSVYLESTRK